MKRNRFYQMMGGLLGATLLLGIPSCSDDHYDIKPAEDTAANTIWQNIESNQQLDSLAMILKRVRVYTREDDKSSKKMTYAELLNTPQTYTFWAPLNGTYNAKAYLDQLDEVDELRAEGKSSEADKLEYTLGVQFAQNHLARFNYESNMGEQEVRLLNGKLCTYHAAQSLFNGVALNKDTKNVPSSNGTMHLLEGQSPFAYNIYDYMAANTDLFSKVYGTLSARDSSVFSESASIPGGLNENGEMVYVDSVYYTYNELLNNSNAQIKNEDSLYVAMIPSDAAWDQAVEKISKLFNYADSYKYNYTGGSFLSTYKLNADSLRDYNTNQALITSMYFSPSIFSQEFSRDDFDGIVNYVYNADSLISTNNVTYYNPTPGQKNPMFAGAEPVKASNGIIFPLMSYEIDPNYAFVSRQTVNVYSPYSIGNVANSSNDNGVTYDLDAVSYRDTVVDISAMGENKMFRYFQTSRSMTISIPLPNLYSTKYRIRIQIVPNRVLFDHMWQDNDGNEVLQESVFSAELRDDNNKKIADTGRDLIQVSDDAVMNYTLWEEVEIPNCYVDLPSNVTKSYPVLNISYRFSDQGQRKKGANGPVGISISKIFIDPVRE